MNFWHNLHWASAGQESTPIQISVPQWLVITEYIPHCTTWLFIIRWNEKYTQPWSLEGASHWTILWFYGIEVIGTVFILLPSTSNSCLEVQYRCNKFVTALRFWALLFPHPLIRFTELNQILHGILAAHLLELLARPSQDNNPEFSLWSGEQGVFPVNTFLQEQSFSWMSFSFKWEGRSKSE